MPVWRGPPSTFARGPRPAYRLAAANAAAILYGEDVFGTKRWRGERTIMVTFWARIFAPPQPLPASAGRGY